MYEALYRKWRSKKFNDIVGQEHITLTLKNEALNNKPSHAYLFTGSRGTGKTSCAKIMAKAVNCPQSLGGEPCDICDICHGIDNGSILDVVEIDAASNNSVENVRSLREEANFTPAVCKYRVYIIDEVHMLSISAFNALLKIMEEPPRHVIFILATTEVHKVPATILSRTQRFDFKRISTDKIASHLEFIASKENFSISPGAAALIAKLSDGGMRDAISLLDLASSYSDEITEDIVRNATGLVPQNLLNDISQAIIDKNFQLVLSVLGRHWENTTDYERLCEQIIYHYRNIMLIKASPENASFTTLLPDDLTVVKKQALDLTMHYIMLCISTLQDVLQRISRCSNKQAELEIGLVRLCMPHPDFVSLHDRIEKLEMKIVGLSSRPEYPSSAPSLITSASQSASFYNENPDIGKKEVALFTKWDDVVAQLNKINAALHSLLTKSVAYTHDDLLLIQADDFFFKFVRENEKAKEDLRKALLMITGVKYRLGPYKEENYKLKDKDPLDKIIRTAVNSGIQIK